MHLQAKLMIDMSKLFPPAPSYLLQHKNKQVPNHLTARTDRQEKRKPFSDEPVRLVSRVQGKHKFAITDTEEV